MNEVEFKKGGEMILKKKLMCSAFKILLVFGSVSLQAANEITDQEITNAVNSELMMNSTLWKAEPMT